MKGMQLLTLTQDACVGLIPRSFAHGERTVGAALRPRPLPQQDGQVAQLVEQRTENPRVGGSIPPLATTFSLRRPATYKLAV